MFINTSLVRDAQLISIFFLQNHDLHVARTSAEKTSSKLCKRSFKVTFKQVTGF